MNKQEKSLGLKNSGTKDQEKETTVVWTRGKDGGEKTTKCSFTRTCRGKEKQRETEEDLDGQCQGRSEREKHRIDQDWCSDQKHRGLEESCKSLIVSTVMEERTDVFNSAQNIFICYSI